MNKIRQWAYGRRICFHSFAALTSSAQSPLYLPPSCIWVQLSYKHDGDCEGKLTTKFRVYDCRDQKNCSITALLVSRASSPYRELESAYVKCCHIFVRYSEYHSVTVMLAEINMSDFDTVIDGFRRAFHRQILVCDNDVVNHFVRLHLLFLIMWIILSGFSLFVCIYVCISFSCYELLSEMNEWINKSLFAHLSTRTMTILYKVNREQDSKTQRMTLYTAALDNTNAINTVDF